MFNVVSQCNQCESMFTSGSLPKPTTRKNALLTAEATTIAGMVHRRDPHPPHTTQRIVSTTETVKKWSPVERWTTVVVAADGCPPTTTTLLDCYKLIRNADASYHKWCVNDTPVVGMSGPEGTEGEVAGTLHSQMVHIQALAGLVHTLTLAGLVPHTQWVGTQSGKLGAQVGIHIVVEPHESIHLILLAL